MNQFNFTTWLAIIVISVTAVLVQGQTPLGPQDSAKLPPADLSRLKVGDEAPDFTLEDQDMKPVTLSSYRGKKTVVLVFYRGYW